MSNIKNVIDGKLAQHLAEVFGQLEEKHVGLPEDGRRVSKQEEQGCRQVKKSERPQGTS